jgi:hypothetical protein
MEIEQERVLVETSVCCHFHSSNVSHYVMMPGATPTNFNSMSIEEKKALLKSKDGLMWIIGNGCRCGIGDYFTKFLISSVDENSHYGECGTGCDNSNEVYVYDAMDWEFAENM